MMDQYKERYKQETEQIHAPVELIVRTKAAMREEEARIRRDLAVQTAGSETGRIQAVSGQTAHSAGGTKYAGHFNVRKWAYPLSAAAAFLILVSVSLMMRGMKSGDMAMSVEPSAGMGMESAEMSGGEDLDGGIMTAGAVTDFEGTAEAAPMDEMIVAEEDTVVENEISDMAEVSEGTEEAVVEKEESEEAYRDEGQRKFSDTEKNMAQDAACAESGAQTGDITIEKVGNRPDFCGHPDTKTHVFEGQTFQVAEEENGWAAYAETGGGSKYVIRGEAEDLETFLEMGYQMLLEQK